MTTKSYILGFGSYAPERILTNTDLESLVDTTDEWITTRTGIKQRHMAAEGETTSDLGAKAAMNALASAGLAAKDLTHILVATCTPDAMCPSTACLIERKLGVSGLMAVDLNAACSGFLYALNLAQGIVAMNADAKVLVVAAEVLTRRLNWNDRSTCVLFGDGAGAAIVSARPNEGRTVEIADCLLSSDGALGDLLLISGGGTSIPYKHGDSVGDEFFVRMEGREIFKHAVRSMARVCEELLTRNGIKREDVDMLLPHQANLRIIEAVGKKLDIPAEKVFVNLQEYGNTSAASVPLALADADSKNMLPAGRTILLTTFGGGFTWGAALLRT
ncbi:beta-ketoacyl-ACP synthase III [Oleidesulfovibrio sp.]|uniref:beta-ketoacyl-ACP synthase III n=1 Tax=Oleidesulfovibrio sp. TaxID=2909707 RepID=UPI003A835F71